MSKVEYGQITVVSTGNKIPVLDDSTLEVEKVVLFIGDSSTEVSAGFYDSTCTFTGSAKYQDENNTKALTHYRTIGGVKTKVFECTVTYLDTGEFGINVTTCTTSTSLKFVVFGS